MLPSGPGTRVLHKLSDQLGRSLATGGCAKTLGLAGGAQRTAGRGSLQEKMGTIRGRAASQTTCSETLGDGGGTLKGLEDGAVERESEMTEDESNSAVDKLNVNNGDEHHGY